MAVAWNSGGYFSVIGPMVYGKTMKLSVRTARRNSLLSRSYSGICVNSNLSAAGLKVADWTRLYGLRI